MNSEIPNQVVILCGGLGTRLKPLTNFTPKPMVLINNKPFLHYLIEQLVNQGLRRFVLLIGYLGNQISDYFGDGSNWNLEIKYSEGPADWDTGRRIWEARDKIDSLFFLLYSDNFVQFSFPKLLKLFKSNNFPINLLLAPKVNGNIKVSCDGKVIDYDKNRFGIGFDYVELGYMIVRKNAVFDLFFSTEGFPDFSFSQIIQEYSRKGEIGSLIIRDPYHSISDIDRLTKMVYYLSNKKIILIDRDGTINKRAPLGAYICNVQNFHFIPETYESMKILSKDGFQFIIITNQAGISLGKYTVNDLDEIHEKMLNQFSNDGIKVLNIYYCADHWNDNSFMRKPEPGMFFKASKDFFIRMDKVLYIGDDSRDVEAAFNAGCASIFIGQEKELNHLSMEKMPIGIFESMIQSINLVKSYYENSSS
jgi:histidinol-phosphate phosphatase family protein